MKKKLAFFTFIMLLSSRSIMADTNNDGPTSVLNIHSPKIILDGEVIETQAVINNNKTYVPLRTVLEKMGCAIEWNSDIKSAEVSYNNKVIEFSAYDKDNIMLNDSMYIPLRMAAEFFGADVQWKEKEYGNNFNNESGTVIINTKKQESSNIIKISDTSSFAMKFNSIMSKEKNYFFSPLSVKYALAMAANGADEQTASELTDVLGISDLEQFNDDVKKYLDKEKFDIIDDKEIQLNTGVNINIANSIWLNEDYIKGGDFNDEYKSFVNEKYNATAENVNNSNAIERINKWCNENTNHKIPKIIDSSDFQACLVNAIYFNGKWNSTFSKENTKKDIFTDKNGKQNSIDFMNRTDEYYYYEDSNIKILSLNYNGSSISMNIVLTDDNSIDFEKYELSLCNVNISIPKFKTEYSFNAKDLLQKMGVVSAFDNKSPHFAKMFNDIVNSETNIFISDVLHKAFISVDEEGTEAAAITSLTECGSLDDPEEKPTYEFKADKPFTYFIRDDSTNEIIFMGEYALRNKYKYKGELKIDKLH